MAISIKVFAVTDKVRPKEGDPSGDATEDAAAKRLVAVIKRVVDPDSWDCVGEAGTAKAFFAAFYRTWFLVVRQTDENLTTIQSLLDSMVK